MKRIPTLTLIALTCAALLLVAPSAHADAVNLLANPSFDDPAGAFDGWFSFGSAFPSTPSTDNIFLSDTTSAKVYGVYTNCPIPQFDVSGFGQSFTPVVGQEYELSGFSFVSDADTIPGTDTCIRNRAIAKIVFFDSVIPQVRKEIGSNEIIIGDWNTPREQWIPFSVSAIAPPGAVAMEALVLFLQPGCDDGSVYVDDMVFCEQVPAPDPNLALVNPSFDTDLSGWNVFGNVFYEAGDPNIGRAWAVRTPTGSAAMFGTFSEGNDTGMFQRIDTAPGESWMLSVYALNTCVEDAIRGTNENIAYASIVFRDAAGAELDTRNVIIGDANSPLGTWTNYTIAATAPAGTDSVDALLLFTQGPLLEGGKIFVDDVAFFPNPLSGIGDTPVAIGATLYQNIPNPFNPNTRISFELDQSDNVEIAVYDVKGRLVTTLVEGKLGAGPHSVTWDGTAADGARVASGVYLYALRTSQGQLSKRMVLLK